jgi:hypothetical protein
LAQIEIVMRGSADLYHIRDVRIEIRCTVERKVIFATSLAPFSKGTTSTFTALSPR